MICVRMIRISQGSSLTLQRRRHAGVKIRRGNNSQCLSEVHRNCQCDTPMEIVKIPRMEKKEYDSLIGKGYICRIAFQGEKYPYIAPFLYVFDGKFLYFLSTKYGKKLEYFRKSPYVAVEVEKYTRDLSSYTFVSMQGYLKEVTDSIEKKLIRQEFVDMIKEKRLSTNILAALGHSPQDPPEAIAMEERSLVWKLTGVMDMVALKNL